MKKTSEKTIKLADALTHARLVAKLLLSGARNADMDSIRSSRLIRSLPTLASIADAKSTGPVIKEILIFGSVARGEIYGRKDDGILVGDIDIILLDDGVLSARIEEYLEGELISLRRPDRYEVLNHNLGYVLSDCLNEDSKQLKEALTLPVDLHVLPIEVLWRGDVRDRLASQHWDQAFFENAFSDLLRFDEESDTFEKVYDQDLRLKYDVNASPESYSVVYG